jgi:hypothetical protein
VKKTQGKPAVHRVLSQKLLTNISKILLKFVGS